MKRNNLLLLIIFLAVHFRSTAQQEIALHHQQTLTASSARFFNSGGSKGTMPNEYLKATIKAPSDYTHLFFNELYLHGGSKLPIFKGKEPFFGEMTEKVILPKSDYADSILLFGRSTVNKSVDQYKNTDNVNATGSCYSGIGNGVKYEIKKLYKQNAPI